jgi:hypothetical protein
MWSPVLVGVVAVWRGSDGAPGGWDALLACQGQLRLAPSGHVVGIEMSTALTLDAARGHDVAVLSELVLAAEAGLVEAFSTHQGRGVGL